MMVFLLVLDRPDAKAIAELRAALQQAEARPSAEADATALIAVGEPATVAGVWKTLGHTGPLYGRDANGSHRGGSLPGGITLVRDGDDATKNLLASHPRLSVLIMTFLHALPTIPPVSEDEMRELRDAFRRGKDESG